MKASHFTWCAGPYFEARDYLNYIERTGPWAQPHPQPYVQGTLRFAKGVLCAVLHMTAIAYFPVATLESPYFFGLRLYQKCGCPWLLQPYTLYYTP